MSHSESPLAHRSPTRNGTSPSLAESRQALALKFGLSPEERSQPLPSGRQKRFDNRVAWAKVYLQMGGLLSPVRRGHFEITERGRSVLTKPPERIDIGFLEQFEEFRQSRTPRKDAELARESPSEDVALQVQTPEEALEQAYLSLRRSLTSELLQRVKASTPEFFETLVVDLLLRMGYGGNRDEAGRAIGSSGDEGIDGIISEDRLGLENIYIQAKRWAGTVGRPDIQKFVGALHGKRARKGIFITTGSYSSDAQGYVSHIDPRVVLIDGQQLAEYMVDFGIGVATKATYELKRIDSDYFAEE